MYGLCEEQDSQAPIGRATGPGGLVGSGEERATIAAYQKQDSDQGTQVSHITLKAFLRRSSVSCGPGRAISWG